MVMYTVYSQYFTSTKQLNIGLTFIFSLCLWASSMTMIVAERRARERRPTWLVHVAGADHRSGCHIPWRPGTRVLQPLPKWLRSSSGPSSGATVFGSVFYVLTGFHGFHVLIGLVCLIVILCMSKHWSSKNDLPVTVVSYYWHFVDWIWLLIFTLAYIRPLIGG